MQGARKTHGPPLLIRSDCEYVQILLHGLHLPRSQRRVEVNDLVLFCLGVKAETVRAGTCLRRQRDGDRLAGEGFHDLDHAIVLEEEEEQTPARAYQSRRNVDREPSRESPVLVEEEPTARPTCPGTSLGEHDGVGRGARPVRVDEA